MLYRSVSILLIAAIVACPMWCTSGLVSCCSAEKADHASKPSCCHCRPSSADDQQNSPRESPTRPAKSCQGVCGGAVLEKPCLLTENQEQEFLLPLGLDGMVAVPLNGCRSRFLASDTAPGGNIGHMLRTLHMSLLC